MERNCFYYSEELLLSGRRTPMIAVERTTFLYRVVRRDGEKRGIGLCPANRAELVDAVAKPGIAGLAHHHNLQVRRIPSLGNNIDFLLVTLATGGNHPCPSLTLRTD